MADTNPELHAKLQELDHELEEGDITRKGSVRFFRGSGSSSPAVAVAPSVALPRALTSCTAMKNDEPFSCRSI